MHLILLVLHVLGATIIVGSSFVTLFILIKNRIPKENLEFLEALHRVVGPANGIQLLTGIGLASSEWNEFKSNPFFWIKLVLFVVMGIVGGGILGRAVRQAKNTKDGTIPGIARWAWINFLLLMAIAALGVALAESHS